MTIEERVFQLERRLYHLEMLLKDRIGAPLPLPVRSYSMKPAAIRQRRRRGLGEFAPKPEKSGLSI